MALNISFAGYVYDKDSVIVDSSTYYQAYFYNNGTASSASVWNNVRVCEASGYYSFNLGDGDFLTQEGTALSGAIVVIVFWRGDNVRTADCGTLTEWGAFEVVLDGSSVYTNPAQTKDNIAPDLIWSDNIPAHPYVDTSYTIYNTSEDEHSWSYNGTTMNHWFTRYGQDINGPNYIEYTNYYWGDGQTSLNQLSTTNGYHSYDSAGTYDITVEIFDNCGASTSGTQSFNFYWREPVPNIAMTPASPLPNEPVSFIYSGTDIDNRITSIEWVIEDSGVYGNTDTTTTSGRDDTVFHTAGTGTDWYGQAAASGAFTNPGTHTVSIIINWNDGFSDQTINYSENFTQDKFTGPNLSFTQDPALAVVGSGVVFTNTSIDTDRVGLGLPDHEEYFWEWAEAGTVTSGVSDVDYSYQFSAVPTDTDVTVGLCADWSDGWETMVTCLEEPIKFKTTVTITPEDCYYNIKVTGTSDDGTVDGYSWTVSSGTSVSGTWSEVWSSPTNINQQQKTLCFSSTGWYKIEGFVYGDGATTSDFQTIFIDETCPDSGSVYTIWNGTGPLDIGSDWVRIGEVGVEDPSAVYQGTNGLLLSGLTAGDYFAFHRHGFSEIDINNYDFLSFWINLQTWETSRDLKVKLFSTLDPANGRALDLSNYLILNQTESWQRVMIPLKRFKVDPDKDQVGWPTHVNQLEFYVEGQHSVWIDDIALVMGELITLPISVPDMETTQVGNNPKPTIMTPAACTTAYPGPINI